MAAPSPLWIIVTAATTVPPGTVGVSCSSAGGVYAITLASTLEVPDGHRIIIKRSAANANDITVTAGTGDTIDGVAAGSAGITFANAATLSACELIAHRATRTWEILSTYLNP